jgi:FkbM family methyltransferase
LYLRWLDRLCATAGFIRAVRNWPRHYLARHAGSTRPVVFELRNGLRFETRAGTLDAAIFKEVFVRRLYTPAGFEIGPRDVVVDVGAQIGAFSVFAAHAAAAGRVVAFEPAPANFELLKRNLERNALRHVEAVAQAVSGAAGERELRLSQNTGGHSFHAIEESAPIALIKVAAVTLADVAREREVTQIDFLKMDCEGEEYGIIAACPDELLRRVRRIAMEVHDLDETRNAGRLCEQLTARGLEVRHEAKPDGTSMMWARWPASATAQA